MASRTITQVFLIIMATLFFSQCSQISKNGQSSSHSPILFQNVSYILTMDSSLGLGKIGLIQKKDVLINKHKIIAIKKDIPFKKGYRVINGHNKILMPGFVNTHDHLWQSLIRGCGLNHELLPWLKKCVFPLKKIKLPKDTAYNSVKLSIIGLIETGVTTVLDWSHGFSDEFTLENIKALNDSKIRYSFAYGGRPNLDFIQNKVLPLIKKSSLGDLQMAGHPSPFNQKKLNALGQIAKKLYLPINVHLLESREQIQEKPIDLLKKYVPIDHIPYLIFNHAVHLSDSQIAWTKKIGARISHNPASNMRLASGIIPLHKYQRKGVAISIGLDGGTNDVPDMFSNLKMAVGLQRGYREKVSVYPSTEDILLVATKGGAQTLNLGDQIGQIKAGYLADVILITPQKKHFSPLTDIIGQIIFNGRPSDVEYVVVNGHILKEKGKVMKTNEKELSLMINKLQKDVNDLNF